jgi:prepilin-type N-terminal cleavage/methylation domain-containing protein
MKRPQNLQTRRTLGFTLIEILIVVVILGIIAGIVITQFTDIGEDAEQTAFITSGKTFVRAAQRYYLDNKSYPNDAPGTLPAGFEKYITGHQFEAVTPVGGLWDTSENAFGVKASLGVFFGAGAPTPHQDDAFMQEIDAIIDDGDLSTGGFRKMSNTRYFWVVAY